MTKEDNEAVSMAKQQMIMEVQMIQQRAQQGEEQLKAIDEQSRMMEELSESIKTMTNKENNGREMMMPIGRGIFIKGIPNGRELLVNVGSNVAVMKTPEETVEIISKQSERLDEMKKITETELLNDTARIQEIIKELYS